MSPLSSAHTFPQRNRLARAFARAMDLVGISLHRRAASTYPDGSVLFDGKRFHNPYETPADRIPDKYSYQKECRFHPWVERRLRRFPPPPDIVRGEQMQVTLMGHASLLVQTNGLNLLTDPVWSDHVGPMPFMGNCRFQAMGLALGQLPLIDLVAVSHDHYDHFDPDTLRYLAQHSQPKFVVPFGMGELFSRHGIRGDVHELGMYETWRYTSQQGARTLDVSLVPARHSARRGLLDANRRLWGGYLFDAGAGSVFFAGDTGYSAHMKDIRARYGRPRLTLLPIGGYEPRGLFSTIHMNPAEAVRAHRDLDSPLSIAMHHATFRLTGEKQDQPVEDLARARKEACITDLEFRLLENGEGISVPNI